MAYISAKTAMHYTASETDMFSSISWKLAKKWFSSKHVIPQMTYSSVIIVIIIICLQINQMC